MGLSERAWKYYTNLLLEILEKERSFSEIYYLFCKRGNDHFPPLRKRLITILTILKRKGVVDYRVEKHTKIWFRKDDSHHIESGE